MFGVQDINASLILNRKEGHSLLNRKQDQSLLRDQIKLFIPMSPELNMRAKIVTVVSSFN